MHRNLVRLNLAGLGVPNDTKLAAEWFARAAAQGDAQAAKNLHDVRQTESQTVMQRFLFNRRPWAFDDKEPLYIVNMAQ
ncbi:MAG: hypothetical protein ABSC95_20275 [Acetobacteraceae bacterium]|jgi:TPR repeat protein